MNTSCGSVSTSLDDAYAPCIGYPELSPGAVHGILATTLNTVLAAAATWRVAGPDSPYARAARRHPAGPVPLWGGPGSRAPYPAATLNGAVAHHFTFDDTADVLLAHPSVVLVPALLASTAAGALTVPDYVAAYASGYETMVRLARLVNPGHYLAGHHATSTLGVLGAANAVAVALGGDQRERTTAIGLAAARAAGVRANIGHDARAWHAGFAASAGLECADLAHDGVVAGPAAITGRHGFLRTLGALSDGALLVPPADDGPALNVAAPLNLKRYPGCGAVAPAVDAAVACLAELGAGPEDVLRVDVRANPMVGEVVTADWPDTIAAAGFSLRFALAVALCRGTLRPEHLTSEMIASPRLRALADRITIGTARVGETKYETEVTVRTAQGRTASVRRAGVGGSPVAGYDVPSIVGRWAQLWEPGARPAIAAAAEALVAGRDLLAGRLASVLSACGPAIGGVR